MIANSLSMLAVGNDLWYALPLMVVISLVYAAARDEQNQIWSRPGRIGTWICGFMFAIFVVLALMSWYVFADGPPRADQHYPPSEIDDLADGRPTNAARFRDPRIPDSFLRRRGVAA